MTCPKRIPLAGWRFLVLLAAACAVVVAPVPAGDVVTQKHSDVLAAKVRPSGTDTFDFDVTVSLPYILLGRLLRFSE